VIFRAATFILLTVVLLSGCAAPLPTWRARVAPLVEEIGRQDASRLFPQEYRNLLETFEHGEAVFHVTKDHKLADSYYQMAFQKAELLQAEFRRIQQRQVDEEHQRIAEIAAKAEEEQLMFEAAQAELLLREQERIQAEAEARIKAESQLQRPRKEPSQPQPTSYTVRRGETLPQISGRAEIYNNSNLWPIIYRANRDQIRDPKRLWPGQVLTIPRHFNRNDADDARRHAGK
jgi:hypothetical protein